MQHCGKENDGCDIRILNEDECTTEINVCPIEYDDDSESNNIIETEILVNVENDLRSGNDTIVQKYAESIWHNSIHVAMERIMKRQSPFVLIGEV